MTRSAAPAIVRPKAILFDWDNTLVDSWATIHDALNIVMAAMDKPAWTIEETRGRVRLSLRESFPLHFGERWEEARDIYLDAFTAIHLDRLAALPGRDEMLRGLAEAGFYLGVVSNKTGRILRLEAERIGWWPLFGRIVGAGDATADKPAAAPIRLALEPSALAAGDAVWFVGDTGIDMVCARNADCVGVLLGDGVIDAELRDAPPHLSFAEPADLFRFVQGL